MAYSAIAVCTALCAGLNYAAAAERATSSQTITCAAIAQPFYGTLCAPPALGRHAAIVLLGGSEGGDSMAHAAQLFARKGYVAASVAYFGASTLPSTLVNVPVEVVGNAVAALRARPDVDQNKIGIFGASRGGELALLAASTYPDIHAVVAVVPSPYAFMGLGENDFPTGCAWSFQGKPLPSIEEDAVAGERIGLSAARGEPLVLKNLYQQSLDAAGSKAKDALFPLERIRGPVLCVAGSDDLMWNSGAHCRTTLAFLRMRQHPYDDAAVVYPSAGHTFISATRGPTSAVTEYSVGRMRILLGGTRDGDAAAATDAWKRIWSFFSETLDNSVNR